MAYASMHIPSPKLELTTFEELCNSRPVVPDIHVDGSYLSGRTRIKTGRWGSCEI